MASNEIANVCRFLAGKQINITSSNEWLVACIQWFLSENEGSSIQEIQKFAYEQLLLADLNVISQACLPSNINESHTIKLQGKYFLQVNYFIDVGQSAYSQYQKILKRNTTEIEDDQDGHVEEKRYWETQPNRMLKMEMTDGVHKVYGMEYSSITKLNSDNIIPGIKVLVKGPVECRSGVIMLQENNIEVLGGEVDSLFEVNHTNKLIARKLNLDENLIPLEITDADVPAVINHVQSAEQKHPTSNNLHNSIQPVSRPRQNNNENYFEDSDVFLNVPVDHLMENDNVIDTDSFPVDHLVENDNVIDTDSFPVDHLMENDNVIDTDSCEPTGNKVIAVEASVVAFKSKLLIKDDNWTLKVKLNTNNGSVKASFDSDLLDKLIGFSPLELSLRETEMSVNPAIKEQMDKMLKRSQQVIKNLKCCMTLAQNEGDELPVIIALSDESAFCNSL